LEFFCKKKSLIASPSSNHFSSKPSGSLIRLDKGTDSGWIKQVHLLAIEVPGPHRINKG